MELKQGPNGDFHLPGVPQQGRSPAVQAPLSPVPAGVQRLGMIRRLNHSTCQNLAFDRKKGATNRGIDN
jgi:hypothetical protein